MKLTILLLLFYLVCIPVTCQANYDWSQKSMGIGHDKYFHFFAGSIINQTLKDNTKLKWADRQLIVLGIGIAKELSDKRFDAQDLGATVLGGLLSGVRLEWRF